MEELLPRLIAWAGAGQLMVLFASALVPFRLALGDELRRLPTLHRQLFWVYGGYVVLSIAACGLVSLAFATELASGEPFPRAVCGYVAVFWGVRLSLVWILDAEPYLTSVWLRLGYHGLTAAFVAFTALFAYAALRP